MKKLLLFVVLVAACTSSFAYSDRYDHTIKKWASYYMPAVDWKLLKAQFIAESNLNAGARSPVGAHGIAQIMPATWNEISRQLKIRGSSTNADLNIQFGAYYMGRMMGGWTPKGRKPESRIKLSQASYNAGLGNIYKAQKKSGGAMEYDQIIGALPKVTGRHSKETIGYVKKIWNYWKELKLM